MGITKHYACHKGYLEEKHKDSVTVHVGNWHSAEILKQ